LRRTLVRPVHYAAKTKNMFIINLVYKVSLEEIDKHMKAHVIFLNKYYKAGNFLVSGRKIPRSGGIIIAIADNKKIIQTIIKEDPFYKYKLAKYSITEFNVSQKAKNIDQLIS